MAERRENSVLFSLKELRRIEDDRLDQEKKEADAKADAERQAKLDAERRAREEEERKRREEEERIRAIEDAKERQAREERMRLEETERKARIEGEMKIKEQQMRLEVQARAEGKSPAKAIAGVVIVLVGIGGFMGYSLVQKHNQERAQLEAEKQRLAEDAKKAQAELEAQIDSIKKEMSTKLAAAKTDEERQAIMAEARAKQDAAAREVATRSRHRPSGGSKASGASKGEEKSSDMPSTVQKVVKKKNIGDNPLDGLNL